MNYRMILAAHFENLARDLTKGTGKQTQVADVCLGRSNIDNIQYLEEMFEIQKEFDERFDQGDFALDE